MMLRFLILLGLTALGLLLLCSPLLALRFDETHVICQPELRVQLKPGPNDGDAPSLVAEAVCSSYAADGTPLRQITKNIAGDLTANQVQMFTRVLQRLERTVARRASIPTPLATPTDIVVRTPAPE